MVGKMKNIGAIMYALLLAAHLLNAQEMFEDKEIDQVNDPSESNNLVTYSFDSGTFTNNNLLKLSKAKIKSFEKPMYFKNTRHIRKAEVVDTKFITEGEMVFRSDSPMSRIRSAEDSVNDEVITTLPLPLENSFTSSSDTTENPIDVVETSTVIETDMRASLMTEKDPEVTTSINNFNSVQTTADSISFISEDESTSVLPSEDNQMRSSIPKLNSNSDVQAPILVNNQETTGISTNDLLSHELNVSADATTAPNVEAITGNITYMDTMSENTENKKTINTDEDEPSIIIKNEENDEISKNNADELTKGLFDKISLKSTADNRTLSKTLPVLPSDVNVNSSSDTLVTENINNDKITKVDINISPDILATENIIHDQTTTTNVNNPANTLATEDIINNNEINTTHINSPPESIRSNDGEDDTTTDVDDLAGMITANSEVEEVFHKDSEHSFDVTMADNTEIEKKINSSFETTSKSSNVTGTNDNNTDIEATFNSGNPNLNFIKNFNYLVYGDSDVPCTLASMGITLKLTYKTNHKKTVTTKIQVPAAAAVNGTCGKTESYLSLIWIEGSPDNGENNVTFKIFRERNIFYVDNVQVSIFLDEENFPNSADMLLYGSSKADLKLFSGSIKGGVHVCNSQTEVLCGRISVLIKDVSIIAYNDKHDVSYREEELCSPPRLLSIAAIVGGLIGIVVTIGIIASYAWHRKKTSTFRSELP